MSIRCTSGLKRMAAIRPASRRAVSAEDLESRCLLTAILSDQTVTGTIATPTSTADYEITLAVGQSLVATVGETTTSAFDPAITIIRPDNTIFSADSGELGTLLSADTVTQAGVWIIRVSDGGSNDTGSYRLTVAAVDGNQSPNDGDGGSITNGQRKDGFIELGDIDTYTIGALAGETLLVSAVERRGNHAFDPRLRIFGPTGVELFDDASSLGSAADLEITTSGDYYFVVTYALNYSAGDRAMATGEYTLRALLAPLVPATNDDADGGTVTSGQRVLGTLDRGDFDVFSFAADSGDDMVMNVAAITGNAADPYIRIYAPNGELLSDTVGPDLAAAFPLTLTGTYLVVISDALNFTASDRNFEIGDYALSLALTPAPQTTDSDSGTISSGQSRAGALSIGDIDVWQFNATAGVPFTVNLLDTATGAFEPTLLVFGPTGNMLFNSAGVTSVTYMLADPTASGTYTAFVCDSQGDESGAYAIALNTAAGADNFAPSVLRSNYRYNDPLPSLRVEFSEPVAPSFSIDDFTLKNLTTNTTLDNFSLTTTFEVAKDNFVVTFDSFAGRVLPDGNYRLTIPAGNIRDAANNPMAADLAYDFFVLAGDANRDRKVDFNDLVVLAQNYNTVDRTFAEGNFDYSADGVVDFNDLVLLAQRYGHGLSLASPIAVVNPTAVPAKRKDRGGLLA